LLSLWVLILIAKWESNNAKRSSAALSDPLYIPKPTKLKQTSEKALICPLSFLSSQIDSEGKAGGVTANFCTFCSSSGAEDFPL